MNTKTYPTPGSKRARAARRAHLRQDMAAHPGLTPMQAVLAETKKLCDQVRSWRLQQNVH